MAPNNERKPSVRYQIVSIDHECNTEPMPSVHHDPLSHPCFTLLRQFYDELMVSAFPLEDERDDLEDWFQCFRMQMNLRQMQKKADEQTMDLVVMILDEEDDEAAVDAFEHSKNGRRRYLSQSSMFGGLYTPTSSSDETSTKQSTPEKPIIIGGAAVEYYQESRVGLLSYVVLHSDFRGRGLAKYLHEEALSRLEILANTYGTPLPSTPLMQAVFAETNTAAAGDVTPEQSLLRHKSLYNLGYRLVNFPYAQPPLSTEDVDASFDELVLLVYFPFTSDSLPLSNEEQQSTVDDDTTTVQTMKRFCSWYKSQSKDNNNRDTVQMDVSIPFDYVEDFYNSVFGYENGNNFEEDVVESIPDYHTAKYYQLAHWFTRVLKGSSSDGLADVSLNGPPWEDCKDALRLELKGWQRAND